MSVIASTPTREDVPESQEDEDVPPTVARLQTSLRHHARMTMPGAMFQGATMQWYADNNVRRLDWPTQSPDLDPIEHLWDEFDRRVRARQARPKYIAQLMEWFQEEWRRIPVDVLQTLVESMPDRVAAVIAARVFSAARVIAREIRAPVFWDRNEYGAAAGETGAPLENTPASGVVRRDSHMQKFGSDPAGVRTLFALVEGEQSNHSATAAPIIPKLAYQCFCPPPCSQRFPLPRSPPSSYPIIPSLSPDSCVVPERARDDCSDLRDCVGE
ncbi:hypothetical protein PR048_032832 [Dryococelus australis]|uniref:Transposase n=1 Tax=Dryococelus australis TaxID=614101 RepID=A0ABQ9G3C5_9NEOP|nr:hypothetical protein PR048_032832 [Dryococelus australis]